MSSRNLIIISRFLSPSDRVQRRDNIKNWRKHISERDKYVLEEWVWAPHKRLSFWVASYKKTSVEVRVICELKWGGGGKFQNWVSILSEWSSCVWFSGDPHWDSLVKLMIEDAIMMRQKAAIGPLSWWYWSRLLQRLLYLPCVSGHICPAVWALQAHGVLAIVQRHCFTMPVWPASVIGPVPKPKEMKPHWYLLSWSLGSFT